MLCVNTALCKWYVLVCSKNIFPGDPELIEKAKRIAQQLGKSNFKAKARYNIKRFSVCGESGGVQGCTVDSWKERLPEIVAGYKKEDVWTWMRAGCFGGLYQIRGLERKERGVREARSLSTG